MKLYQIKKSKILVKTDKLPKLKKEEFHLLELINLKVNTQDLIIYGDEDQLNRVFINLIKNSEEALVEISTKDPSFKGIIDIEINDNNDYIRCRLTDNGPGITDAKKAMTPYFTTKKKGTGLGLPIVSKIINEHSGTFSIKNNKKDKGTIITILLPKTNE